MLGTRAFSKAFMKMASTTNEEKKLLRKRIKELSRIDEEHVKQQSASVTRKVLSLPDYQDAQFVSVFMSMPNREVSTTEIVRDALRQGKQVFIPYIYSKPNQKQKLMEMLRLKDEEDLSRLEPDSWGIPSLADQTINLRENAMGGTGISDRDPDSQTHLHLDLIFVPGMAFDASNNRLGHGKGFYDRYFSRIKALIDKSGGNQKFPALVGLSLHEQLLSKDESVPITQEDWKVDYLVTADHE